MHNNELGFSEDNIRALCDVGRSTKVGGLGYIGQKGIGWKSVFRVTDQPRVHSNGFHVKFDLASDSSLGYILPTWVGAEAEAAAWAGSGSSGAGFSRHAEGAAAGVNNAAERPAFRAADGAPADAAAAAAWDGRGTLTVLPLRRQLTGAAGVALRRRFEDIQPTLLLFLQKLTRISVTALSGGGGASHAPGLAGHRLLRSTSSVMVRRGIAGWQGGGMGCRV